jgi:hypothetical protein
MSDDQVTGAMIVSPVNVYFIPESDLDAYRLPDEVAGEAREWLEGQAPETTGYSSTPSAPSAQPSPAQFAVVTWQPTLSFGGYGMMHTATRF